MGTDNTKAKLGIKARQDALRSLIKNHQEEFDTMVEENRVSLGLSRRATNETPDEIRAKFERAQQRAEKYRLMLEEAEADLAGSR